MGEGVAGEGGDGIPGERDLRQRGRVAEAVGLDVLEGGILNLVKGRERK